MNGFNLFRRRMVLLPTPLGWTLVIAAAVGLVLMGGRCAYPWLAQQQPAPDARVLVVEGWLAEPELDQAIALIRRSKYERVVTIGGPIDSWTDLLGARNFADLSASYLRRNLAADVNLISLPSPGSDRDRSFLAIRQARQWLTAEGLRPAAIDIVSSGAHARRSRMVGRRALGADIELGIVSVQPAAYPPDRWWTTSAGVKAVVGEIQAVAWTACCFHPDIGDTATK